MDKDEIIRICTYFNQHNQYAESFETSKDLGLVSEVIPILQENIPTLLASIEDSWTTELKGLGVVEYLKQVVGKIPKVQLRLVAIGYILHNSAIQFSFDFNMKDSGVKVQGISIVSFGVNFSVTGNRNPQGGKRIKRTQGKTKRMVTEHFMPLKKAS